MSIRTILVPLDGGRGDRRSLHAAFQVARHARERIFGGVTRHLLLRTNIPLWLSH